MMRFSAARFSQFPLNLRAFSTQTLLRKSATDAAKDTLKSVDRTVSDAAVSGIETGEKAVDSAKAAVGMKSKEVQGEASKLSGQAQGKASELKGQAKGKVEELKGKAEGAMKS